MAKELLLAGKKVGETSFLSRHTADGVYKWANDGEMLKDGLKHFSVKPGPILANMGKSKSKDKSKRKGRRMAIA